MDWSYLLIAGLLEMVGVDMLNRWQRDKQKIVLVWMFSSFAVSLCLLSLAMKTLSMSTAYAVWTGIGAVGGASLSIIKYGESAEPKRILCIALILVSAIGLKLCA